MAEGTAVLKASHGVVWADGAEGEGEEEEEEAAAAAADDDDEGEEGEEGKGPPTFIEHEVKIENGVGSSASPRAPPAR